MAHTLFPFGHATHPQWRMAAALVLAQLRGHMALPEYASTATLGLLYITDRYAEHAEDILQHISAELPEITDWAGTVGVGIASSNVEYFDEPALAVMLCDIPSDQYRVFSGVAPLSSHLGMFEAHTALVHADGNTPELTELLQELAQRTETGYLFGGLASSRQHTVQFAISGNGNVRGQGKASGVFRGGLSGVAFGPGVTLLSRVTQGCEPVVLANGKKASVHTVTASEGHVVTELDGQPALDVLLADLNISLDEPRAAMQRLRSSLVGLAAVDTSPAPVSSGMVTRHGSFGAQTRVRHIIGLDPVRRGVAVADLVPQGSQLVFCERDVQAARRDLVRICTEIREELEPAQMGQESALDWASASAHAPLSSTTLPDSSKTIMGAIYVSCTGRGGPHFGGPGAELQIVRRALGDVPLVGFFAGGEIAHQQLYGYTGVLTVFTA